MKERFLGGRKTKWIELLGFVYISGFQGERKKEMERERTKAKRLCIWRKSVRKERRKQKKKKRQRQTR